MPSQCNDGEKLVSYGNSALLFDFAVEPLSASGQSRPWVVSCGHSAGDRECRLGHVLAAARCAIGSGGDWWRWPHGRLVLSG